MIPTPAQVVGFADGLVKIRDAEKAGQGTDLTPTEVSGLLWAIKQLRGGVRDPASVFAIGDRTEASGS